MHSYNGYNRDGLIGRLMALDELLDQIEAQRDLYEYTLSFYADEHNWGWKDDNCLQDRGERAREALNDGKS